MPSPITGVNSYPTSFNGPDDGDDIAASSVGVPFEALANRTEWLKAQIAVVDAKISLPGGGNIVRTMPPIGYFTTESTARAKTAQFFPDSALWNGSSMVRRTCVQSGSLKFLTIPGDPDTVGVLFYLNPHLVNGATLASIEVAVQAAAHGSLPGTQMSCGVFRVPQLGPPSFTSLRTAGDFVTDAAASTAAYAAAHLITLTPDQFQTIDKTNFTYWLQVWDEFGTNTSANNQVHGVNLSMSGVTSLRIP